MAIDLKGNISGIDDLLRSAVQQDNLGDDKVNREVLKATAKIKADGSHGDLSFGFNLENNVGIFVFNSADDTDESGVVSLPGKDEVDEEGVVLAAPLKTDYAKGNVVVKTSLASSASGNLKGSFSPAVFSINGGKKILLEKYNTRLRTDNAFNSLIEELTDFDYALSAQAIKNLRDGQALSYRLAGSLTASVSVTWSDLLGGNLNLLTGLLARGEAFSLQAQYGATVEVIVALEDDFAVIFTRKDAQNVRVSLKKVKSRKLGVEGKLHVEAGFKDQKAAQAQIEEMIKSVVGEGYDKLKKVIDNPGLLFSQLNSTEREIIKQIANRIKLPAPLDDLTELRDRWRELEKTINAKITEIVKTKVELAFKATYSRLKVNTVILVADLTHSALDRHHKELLLCNIEPILAQLRAGHGDYQLVRFLNQTVLETLLTWGLTFRLGKLAIGGQDSISKRRVILENFAVTPEKKISYTQARGYESTIIQDKESWVVTFKSHMDSYEKNPTTCDFDYGLNIVHEWTEQDLDEEPLQRALDLALIWRAIDADDVEPILAEHRPLIAAKEKAVINVEMAINNDALRKLLSLVASAKIDDIARAYGKAMRWIKNNDKNELIGRANAELRMNLYAPVWKGYLINPGLEPSDYASMAANELAKHSAGKTLVNSEKRKDPFSFAWVVEKTGFNGGHDFSGISDNWNDFQAGMRDLNNALPPNSGNGCRPFEEIEKVFKKIHPFWSQHLYVRALGVLIISLALTSPGLIKGIERTLKISYPKTSKDKVFIYSVSL